jgi:RNA polymerase sigma factor (sigma-70 family)
VTEALEQVPDVDLISAVRAGDVAAFGVLYERHLVAAKRAASCLASTPAEREDLVAEAFTRVLRMLRDGRGPNEEFRPYLLVTLRNTAINATTRGAPVSLYADVPEVSPSDAADDPVIGRWHATVAADAFASLPERWRVVLWHTEVENESPATVAPLLGMRPNSVAALAYRAREGLRQAYLRMHVPDEPRRECRPTVHKLAGYVRHSIPLPLSRKIDKHLAGCAECRRRVSALRSVNDELRGLLGPVVLGTTLAAAYLPAPAAVSGAVTGALSGAAGVLTGGVTGTVTGTATGTVTGAVGAATGTLAGAAPVLAASDAAAAVSSLLAVKTTVVQVATAVAIAAASTTVSAAAPAGPAPSDRAEVPASTRVPAGHGGSSLRGAPVTPPPAGTSHRPVSTSASGAPTTTRATDKAAAKQAKKDAKAAKKAAKAAKKAAKKGGAAQDEGTSTKPPKKSKDKKDKKPKKPKKKK